MDIIGEIKKSKKYPAVYEPLLIRICAEESAKYKKGKEIIKAVKNRLHVIYGAYFGENAVKKAADLISGFSSMREIFKLSENLAELNSSSVERLEFIREFYKFIFESVPVENIVSILDIGCGFNPFFLPFIYEAAPKLKLEIYCALDIDVKLAGVLNEYLNIFGLPKKAGCIDIISKKPDQDADMAFLFKIIPTLETYKKGSGFDLLNNLGIKYAAVSFPTKTLCGKNIGMAENYAKLFEKNIDRCKFSIINSCVFKNELVYILKN